MGASPKTINKASTNKNFLGILEKNSASASCLINTEPLELLQPSEQIASESVRASGIKTDFQF